MEHVKLLADLFPFTFVALTRIHSIIDKNTLRDGVIRVDISLDISRIGAKRA